MPKASASTYKPRGRNSHKPHRKSKNNNSSRDESPRRGVRISGGGVMFTLDTTTIFDKLFAVLQKAHHTCARIDNDKLIWCERDSCPIWHENSKKIQAEQELLEARLKSEGHVCIETMDSWPMQVVWCGKRRCVGERH